MHLIIVKYGVISLIVCICSPSARENTDATHEIIHTDPCSKSYKHHIIHAIINGENICWKDMNP